MIKQKTKIVIASVLKPVDDVRNYEKIGISLARRNDLEIHVMGTRGASTNEAIHFYPWLGFKRLSFSRLLIQLKYWKKLRMIKPKIIIPTTHELLIMSVLHRLLYGSKIVYDVQEDYFKNLWHQHFYPPIVRHLIALMIRVMEVACSPFISAYSLAEKTYQKDIGFVRKKSVVLDNRSSPIILHSKNNTSLKVVFTGTVSHYSKAAESIELFLLLKEQISEAEMTVIGYCPKHSYQENLIKKYGKKVTLKLSDKPVPHAEIINEIARSDLGIIGYQPDPVNRHKMPTKLYEYVVAELPYLVQENTLWSEEGKRLGGAIPIDFEQPDFIEIQSQISDWKKKKFKTDECLWSNNEPKLLDSISSILN